MASQERSEPATHSPAQAEMERIEQVVGVHRHPTLPLIPRRNSVDPQQ